MTTWEKIGWGILGLFGGALICESWPSTQLRDFDSPGFESSAFQAPDGRIRKYVVYVPPEYDGSLPFPLIVFLHGQSQNGFDGRQQLKAGLGPEIAARQLRNQSFPYFVLFPQSHCGWAHKDEDYKFVVSILNSIREEYLIDTKRIFLTGSGSGGEGALRFASAYPGRWAAIIPILSDTGFVEVGGIGHVPVRWYQSNCDDMGFVRDTMMEFVRRGSPFKLIVVDNSRHDPCTYAYADLALYRWLDELMRVNTR